MKWAYTEAVTGPVPTDPAAPDPAAMDVVDRIHDEWTRSYPHLDTRPIAVLGRIQRIASQAEHRLELAADPVLDSYSWPDPYEL